MDYKPRVSIVDSMEVQRLCSQLRLALFFDIMEEARLGPGVTDTALMMTHMDGRELLARISRRMA